MICICNLENGMYFNSERGLLPFFAGSGLRIPPPGNGSRFDGTRLDCLNDTIGWMPLDGRTVWSAGCFLAGCFSIAAREQSFENDDVTRSWLDCSSDCIEGSDQACILASCEPVLCIEPQCVETLAKKILSLVARHEKLHLGTVDLSDQSLDGLSGVDLDLLWMNHEAGFVQQIDC